MCHQTTENSYISSSMYNLKKKQNKINKLRCETESKAKVSQE